NFVNFETGDLSQAAATQGITAQTNLVTNPVVDANSPHSLNLNRSSSVENFEVRAGGTNYYNLPAAYYSFEFEYTSHSGEAGLVNFGDTNSQLKGALHVNPDHHLVFYPGTYSGNLKNPVVGGTVLNPNTIYKVSAEIGTGSNAAWEVRINDRLEMSNSIPGSNTADLLTTPNGSLNLGGTLLCTSNYYYDD